MELFREAASAAEPLALATVIMTSGSTPRHAGAHMLVDVAGKNRGTIGGGKVELEVCRAAAEVAAGGPARRVRHHLVRDLAMCCGGSMELFIEPVGQSREALQAALELMRGRRAGAVIHHLDGRPIEISEGGTPAPGPVLDGDRFVEPIRPGDRAILFGCGHIARALGPLLRQLDFEVVICDDGDTGALEPPPGYATVVESFEVVDVERELGPLGAGDHVLILTRDHAIDQRVLEECLARPALSYLGLIGSRGKVGRFKKRLEQMGRASEESWERLSAPIGLDLGAETPAEIAVSVAGELVARRRGKLGGNASGMR